MMRVLPASVALFSMLAVPASVFAGGGRQAPYQNLFTAQLSASPASRQPSSRIVQFTPPVATPPASAPTIVCGMTVIPGDSNVDPSIARRVPAGAPQAL